MVLPFDIYDGGCSETQGQYEHTNIDTMPGGILRSAFD